MLMVATVNGNGPYYPAIVWKGRRYVQGREPFEDMADALRHAQKVLEALYADMRGEAPFPWA